jgi:hypothetical protein
VFASAGDSDEDCEGHDEEEWRCRKPQLSQQASTVVAKKTFDFHLLLSEKSLYTRDLGGRIELKSIQKMSLIALVQWTYEFFTEYKKIKAFSRDDIE